MYWRYSEISTIANVFVDSQDDIRLILLLMYKTIIIRGPIIIGLSNCPALHTHAQMRIKAKVYCGRPHLRTVCITSFSSSGRLADSRTLSACRQFETVHTLLRRSTLKATRRNGTRKVKYTRTFRLLLHIGNVLKMDSKTKPKIELQDDNLYLQINLCQECKKRHRLDIILNSFELWMNMTKLHRQHFVFYTAH